MTLTAFKKKPTDRLVKKYQYGEVISALKLVYVQPNGQCYVSGVSSFAQAQSIGLALQAGGIGFEGDVLLFGEIADSSFVFASNEQLYLSSMGNLTSTPPAAGFRTAVGSALETGSVLIKIQEPITLEA